MKQGASSNAGPINDYRQENANFDNHGGVIVETLQIEGWQGAPSRPWWDLAMEFMRSNPKTTFGRVLQIVGVIFFAVGATAGIIVQVITDTEVSTERIRISGELEELNSMTFELYSISNLLMLEMEPTYEFNRVKYDDFLPKAQAAQRNVDTKLVYIERWPTDLSAIPENQRVNISTPTALKSAIRLQREMRKSVNGTSAIVDNLAILVRTQTIGSVRYLGWREFLSTFYTFQTYINFKKYALVGRKLAAENRTVDIDDDVYQTLVLFYMRYTQFLKVLSLTSQFANEKVANLSQLDSTKNVDRMHSYVMALDFASISGEEWSAIMAIQDANIYWIMSTLQNRVQAAMTYYSKTWSNSAVISIGLFVAAGAVVFVSIFIHFAATWRIQSQIIESYETLDLLAETLSLLYDCVPRSFISRIKRGELMAAQTFPDACVLIFDMANVTTLMHDVELDDFLDILTAFFEMVEQTLVRYNCCKIDVHGDTFALAAGIGERHNIDHVTEMLFIALELHDRAAEFVFVDMDDEATNKKSTAKKRQDGEDKTIRLKMGIHVGPCYASVLNLRVPTIGLFGEVAQIASVLHAASLPKMTHVSANVRNRLLDAAEVNFLKRGALDISSIGGKQQLNRLETYWAAWVEESTDVDDLAERISMASSRHSTGMN